MKIAIIGRSEILYDTTQKLLDAGFTISCIITAKEAPEYLVKSSDFFKLSESLNVPFMNTSRIAESLNFLMRIESDIAVSVNYPTIIPQIIINHFEHGIINAHGGDLPRYRGNACQAWAILNAEEKIGLCIHRMVGDKLDSGDIIAREYLRIDHTTKVGDTWDWMRQMVPELMLKAIKCLNNDANYFLERQSQNPNDGLRCYPRRPEDGRIDWRLTALEILRLINASNKPYAGAFCFLEQKKIVVWDAEIIVDNEKFCAIPGQVTYVGIGYIDIACGSGKLRLKKIQVVFEGEICPDKIINSNRVRLS